jgi:hypothetical protein
MASRRYQIAALRAIVDVLHRQLRDELDCDERPESALEDHNQELALAGDILEGLKGRGLTIAKARGKVVRE